MRISARNVLASKVTRVVKGAVNAEVDLTLLGGEQIASIITNASADALELHEGKAVYAIIKASDVMVGKDLQSGQLSARNVLEGLVSKVQDGAVNSEVVIQLPKGSEVVASITKESVHKLGLQKGTHASAIIKASHVMVGV